MPSQPGLASTARLQHQRQLEPGPLPGHPDDLAAVVLVELLELRLPVGARGEGDRPVGMQVIDVVERQERVERRIDRRGDAVLAEGAQRVEADHLVLERLAAVARDQPLRACRGRGWRSRTSRSTQIAAAALDRHHPLRLAGQRVGQVELRAGVAAAEVGDAQVGAEQVRTVAQQLERTSTRAPPPRASSHRFFRNRVSTVDVSDTGQLHVLVKTSDSARPSDRHRDGSKRSTGNESLDDRAAPRRATTRRRSRASASRCCRAPWLRPGPAMTGAAGRVRGELVQEPVARSAADDADLGEARAGELLERFEHDAVLEREALENRARVAGRGRPAPAGRSARQYVGDRRDHVVADAGSRGDRDRTASGSRASRRPPPPAARRSRALPAAAHVRRHACSSHRPPMFFSSRVVPQTPPSLVKFSSRARAVMIGRGDARCRAATRCRS